MLCVKRRSARRRLTLQKLKSLSSQLQHCLRLMSMPEKMSVQLRALQLLLRQFNRRLPTRLLLKQRLLQRLSLGLAQTIKLHHRQAQQFLL